MPQETSHPVDEVAALRALVRRLPRADAADARVVETHISLLLLTGDDVYKFKKPVRLPFADFSDAGERERLCHAEVELNRRLAPDLYLGVVRVTGDRQAPRLGGRGRTLAHAVHMRRFDAADEANAALADGRLEARALHDFGARLARFHDEAEVLGPARRLARPRDLARAWRDDLAALEPLERGKRAARLANLDEDWWATFEPLRRRLAARRREGRVRACHGDLHLGNMVLLGEELTAFDCIEFSDEFRFVDVMNELAFLVMDLERHRRPRLAVAFLDGYLAHAGDYPGLELLRLFAAYRASVRAKVAALRAQQADAPKERRRAVATVDEHLELAARLLDESPPARLVLMHGVSGSGKSHLARRLALAGGYLCIRSDVERRRLFDVDSAVGQGRAYTRAGVRATYRRMCEQARHALVAGIDVIADATFGDRRERDRFRRMAARLGASVVILDLHAPPAVLEARVGERAAAGTDVSQADLDVLRRQQSERRSLAESERPHALRVDTSRELDLDRLQGSLRRLAARSRRGL